MFNSQFMLIEILSKKSDAKEQEINIVNYSEIHFCKLLEQREGNSIQLKKTFLSVGVEKKWLAKSRRKTEIYD